MAQILGLHTNNGKNYLEVDSNPADGAGTIAPIGSIANLELANVGSQYLKVGPLDTDWDLVVTANAGANVSLGQYRRLGLYDTTPNAPHIGDTVVENGQNIHIAIEAQATRSVDIDYIIPNPGDAIASANFVLTEGNQVINGNKTFQDDVTINGNLEVNGTLTFLNSTNTNITDKVITLNKGGGANSAQGAGIEFEEAGSITGYVKVSVDRSGYDFLAPNNTDTFTLSMQGLTADRILQVPDTTGVIVARPAGTPGVAGQVAFWQDAHNVISSVDLFWDAAQGFLGIGTNTPSTDLHVVGNARITGLNQAQPVKTDANGNLVNGLIVLTTDVSGILPVANGGTNSSTALSNNRVMVSVGGAIVENAAQSAGSVYFGAPVTGLPDQDNANFFWDKGNARLGLGTATPSRRLDVLGSSLFQSPIRFADATHAKANWEMFQSQVSTTDATATTLASIAVPVDSEFVIEAMMLGRRTGGSAGAAGDSAAYKRTAHFKNVGGVVTLITRSTDFTSESQKPWDGDIVVSGSNCILQVKGALNNNVDWTATYTIQTVV